MSVLLYGSETWPFNKTLAAHLDGFDSQKIRSDPLVWICLKHWTTKTDSTTFCFYPSSPEICQMVWTCPTPLSRPPNPSYLVLWYKKGRVEVPLTPDGWMLLLRTSESTLAQTELLSVNQQKWRILVDLVGSTCQVAHKNWWWW